MKKVTLLNAKIPNTFLERIPDITDYGDPVMIWRYLIAKYGEHELLDVIAEDLAIGIPLMFQMVEAMFAANRFKYQRYLNTMIDYDVLSPYSIYEEHVTGNKIGKTVNTNNMNVTEVNSETSYESTTFKDAYKTVTTPEGSSSVEIERDISETFEDKSLSELSSSEHKFNSRKGNIGNHSNSDLIDKERKTANFSLWEIICADILDITCYKIFTV